MKRVLKKLLCHAVALTLVLSTVPGSVFQVYAADTADLTVSTAAVTTADALKTALVAENDAIEVTADITVDEALSIPENVTVTVTEGKTLRVLDTLTNNGIIDGDGKVAVSTMVYVTEEKENYNVTATKNGTVTGTAPVCTVEYQISLDGGNTWIADTTNGKAQAVTVKTDGTTVVSASFQSAFTSAKTGEVVHMLTDAHVQSTNPKKNNGPLRSYYGLILEGNGHTIFTDLESSGASNEYATVKFTSYLAGTGPEVNPVLKNVTIDSQKNAKADLDVVSGDVTFTVAMYNVNLLGNCQYASFAMKSPSLIVNKSNVESYDCTVSSWDAGSAKAINLYSGKYAVTLNSKCTAYGGIYTKDPANYCAEGYKSAANTDTATMETYPYVVTVNASMVARNIDTGVTYEDLSSALTEASVGDTVQLLQDVQTDSGLNILGTLDLNGYTLHANNYVMAALNGSGIVDSSENNTGLLVTEFDNIKMIDNKPALAIAVTGGYKFVDVTLYHMHSAKNGRLQTWLTQVDQLLVDTVAAQGMAETNIRYEVLLKWEGGSQRFVLNNTDAEKMFANWAEGLLFLRLTNPDAVNNLTCTAQLVFGAETPAEIVVTAGDAIAYPVSAKA